MKTVIGAKTDRGIIREINEDNFCVDEDIGLVAVADGLGGHASGEVASKMAIDVIRDYINRTEKTNEPLIGSYNKEYSGTANRLASAIRLANKAIYEAAQGNSQWQGMGTTISAALLKGNKLSIAHVGDSRIYLARANQIEQLTDDHTLVYEQVRMGLITKEYAEKSNIKNILTNALGIAPDVVVDVDELTLSDGDILILCTDGLNSMVPDSDILSVVTSVDNPSEACERLVEMANNNGGKDNITVITAYIYKKNWLSFLL
jgi:protein phosphatase